MSEIKDNQDFPELVAYLDGELSAEERESVEARLSGDEAYRQELANLQRTWDVLDALPSVRATEEFTQSTVEMVALQATKAWRKESRGRPWILFAMVLVAMIPVAAFCYGYFGRQSELAQPNEQLIADLPIIENLAPYRSVDAELDANEAIRFLEILADEPGLFFNYESNSMPSFTLAGVLSSKQADSVSNEFRNLSKETKEILLLNNREFSRWQSLQPAKTENLRKFHASLEDHPRSRELRESLAKYHLWLKNKGYYLGRDEIDRIKDTSPEDRLKEIKRLEREDFEEKWSRLRAEAPAMQDFAYIKNYARNKVQDLSLDVIQQLDTSNSEEVQKLKQKIENAPTHHHGFAILMRARWKLSRRNADFWSPFEPDEFEAFVSGLSEESRAKLKVLPTDVQFELVQSWIVISMFDIDDSDLQLFHDNGLTGKQRDSLKGLSAAEQKRTVRLAFRMALFQDISEQDDLTKLETGRSRFRGKNGGREKESGREDETVREKNGTTNSGSQTPDLP